MKRRWYGLCAILLGLLAISSCGTARKAVRETSSADGPVSPEADVMPSAADTVSVRGAEVEPRIRVMYGVAPVKYLK